MSMAIVGAARVVFGADTSEFDAGARGIEGVLGRLVEKFREVEARIKHVGAGLSLGITAPLGLFAKGAIGAASDAAEMQSAFEYTFGGMAKSVESWATRTGDAIGRSTQELQGGALAFQQLFRQAAPTEAAAAGLSKQFALLAQDLSSFFNTSPEEALAKLQSGLQGESEPLRAFGVFLNENAVAAQAMAMGLGKTSKELSEQDKILARAALILQGTTAAQGDATRTADSFANRTRALSAAFQEMKVKIGAILLPLASAVVGAITMMVNGFTNLPDWVHKTILVFGALAAAIGPLLLILTTVASFLIARFVSAFGIVGQALALFISPVTTIISLLGEMGLVRVLAMIGSRLLGLFSPIGLAISAFLLFKDQIVVALQAVWASITATLGPPIEAIMAKFSALWAKLSGGPVGAAIAALIGLLMGLKDVIGTGLQAAILLAGEVIERTLAAIVAAFSGLVDVISGVVDVISALMAGDFSGAFTALLGVVDSVFKTLVAIVAAFVPEFADELQAAYLAAKQWLADGFNTIVGWFTGCIGAAVTYVASAFPGIVAAAKSVYEGVKAWLVDAFGGIISFVTRSVKFIVDKYGKMKAMLGLGGTTAAAAPDAPAAAAPPPAAAAPPPVGSGKKKRVGGGTGRKGRDTSHDAENREQMALQVELDAARLRGDVATEAALRRRMELSQQIEAYQRTGLSLEEATRNAKLDMTILDAARAAGMAKGLEADEAAHRIDLARISGNRTLEESLQRQRDLKEAIAGFVRDGLPLEQATARAVRQQLEAEEARAAVRARMLADDEQDRQLRLAQARGDTDERIRQLQREIDIRNRARQLEATMSAADARDKATREIDEADQARQTGIFRQTFRDGVRAALDGDLKGFIKDWWRDRVAKGMEEALNSLADLISSLFSRVGRSGGGGGIGGAIASVVGGIFGGGGGKSIGNFEKPPGFANGGRFKVGGRSGIDQNLVSMRLSKNEIVDISKPGNDNGATGGVFISMPITYSGAVDIADKPFVARMAEAARQAAIQGVMEANRRRG